MAYYLNWNKTKILNEEEHQADIDGKFTIFLFVVGLFIGYQIANALVGTFNLNLPEWLNIIIFSVLMIGCSVLALVYRGFSTLLFFLALVFYIIKDIFF